MRPRGNVNINDTIAAINQMQADGVIQRYAIGGAVGSNGKGRGHADHRSTLMNADSKGLHDRQMTARGEAAGWRFTHSPSPERAREVWMFAPPEPLREAFHAAIQSAQAAGNSDRMAADEAALDYIATRIAPKYGVSSEVIAKRLRVEKFWPPN